MMSLFWILLFFISWVIVSPFDFLDCIQDWKRRINGYVERRAIEKLTLKFVGQFEKKAKQLEYDPRIIDEVLGEQYSNIAERVSSTHLESNNT